MEINVEILLIILLTLWLFTSVLVIIEKKVLRMILWFFMWSMIGAIAFFLLGSPDVAMAEAAISSFSTIVFIICFEKFFDIRDVGRQRIDEEEINQESKIRRYVVPGLVTVVLLGLFIYFIPSAEYNPYLKELYLASFRHDVGGYNVITSIILGYRLYDTLFEALMLVVAVVAVMHMSHTGEITIPDGKHSDIEKSNLANLLLRTIAPITIVFGIYVIGNGFLTAGGGFQGGLAIASFFVCRFLIYDIYDLPIEKVNKLEEMVFVLIVVVAAATIFQGAIDLVPAVHRATVQNIYLIIMNSLVGLKVACGFIILFYRYTAIERN